MKVKSIAFNWHHTGSLLDIKGAGMSSLVYETGKNGCVKIIENKPHAEGMKWNYEVKMDDGSSSRIFNVNFVEYYKPEEK